MIFQYKYIPKNQMQDKTSKNYQSHESLLKFFNKSETRQIENLIEQKVISENSDDERVYDRYVYMVIGDAINNVNHNTIIDNLKKDINMGWNHPVFYNVMCRIKEQDDFILKPFEVEEGVIECRCGSKRVFSYSKQSRSADEPMSTYAQCMQCKATWVYSG